MPSVAHPCVPLTGARQAGSVGCTIRISRQSRLKDADRSERFSCCAPRLIATPSQPSRLAPVRSPHVARSMNLAIVASVRGLVRCSMNGAKSSAMSEMRSGTASSFQYQFSDRGSACR
jgi:hypothetical protein